jgi:glycosyltransferase involved in cell wall biosynthesis
MKILLCNERFLFRFGVDRVLLILGEGLKQRGHTIYVMANRVDPKPIEAFAAKMIEVPQGGDSYLNLNEFTAQWLQEKLPALFEPEEIPDVVIIGGWPFFAAIPVFRSFGIKIIFMDCGAVPLDGMGEGPRITQEKLRRLRKDFLPYANQILAISRFIETSQSLKEAGGDTDVSAILLGANHLEHRLWSSAAIGSSLENSVNINGMKENGRRVILNLGRWENDNYKNSKALFNLIRLIRKNLAGIVTLVLSDGTDMDIPADLKDQIIPIGYPPDEALHDLMREVDAGVSVSLWEGFNLPLAEMQWLGKPVVVFNIGAHPEVIAHPWFLAQDLTQMAEKLTACLQNNGLAQEEHQRAIERFRSNFCWEKVMERYENVLLKIVATAVPAYFTELQIIIDVTNSTHDPANSGVIRVTRSLCCALQNFCKPIFVVWDSSINAYVFPTEAEYAQLGAFNGPVRLDYHVVSHDTLRTKFSDIIDLQDSSLSKWLLLPETIMESNGKHIRDFAQKQGIEVGVIFHDSIPLVRPDLCKDAIILRNHSDYMAGISKCTTVFPNSGFSGQCLTDYWRERNLQPPKVITLLLPGEFRAGPRLMQPALFNSNRINIVCVSTLEPRKNHATLLKGVQLLSKQHPDIDWTLTLVGNRYAGGDDIAQMVKDACDRDFRIRWLGITDDRVLRDLYETCSFTVYTSFIEGYGMPIIESLWHAKPCICHKQGVMAELAKEGGCLTIDVLNANEMANAIFRLSTDRVLYDRLSEQAVQRHIKTWDEYAREMLSHMMQLFPSKQSVVDTADNRQFKVEKQNQDTVRNFPQKSIPSKAWSDILYPGCFTENWQMNDSERLSLTAVLHRHKPRCSIEIGTYKGGSLSLISQYSEMVFSIDIDPSIPEKYGLFKNVSFFTGPSQIILPMLFIELDKQGVAVDFILIDGNHSADGVKGDLESVFAYKPKVPLFVMMHDGFNPECRRGMLEANWNSAKYLCWADLDFIPGRLVEHGGVGQGELWGGLGCACFGPVINRDIPSVIQSAKKMQEWVAGFKTQYNH